MQGDSEIIKIPNIMPIRERAWYRTTLISSGLIIFGMLAFGLGRLSRIEDNKPDLVITQTANPLASQSGGASDPKAARASLGTYVASKNGTKYYLSTCSSAKRISPANLVHFASKALAEARGLTPAANCPGL